MPIFTDFLQESEIDNSMMNNYSSSISNNIDLDGLKNLSTEELETQIKSLLQKGGANTDLLESLNESEIEAELEKILDQQGGDINELNKQLQELLQESEQEGGYNSDMNTETLEKELEKLLNEFKSQTGGAKHKKSKRKVSKKKTSKKKTSKKKREINRPLNEWVKYLNEVRRILKEKNITSAIEVTKIAKKYSEKAKEMLKLKDDMSKEDKLKMYKKAKEILIKDY